MFYLIMASIYNKEKIIGSGTYGNVWLIRSKRNNSPYVLKEVNLTSLSPSERQQALTEVAILSTCKHANIIRYKDSVIDHSKGTLSIIMEYADRGDLYTAIVKQRGVPFKEHTVIMWFVQMCLALQYIHNKNILHRDLKTRNIFLTRDRKVKVGDFGIARCLAETAELATTAIGTPYYLSPEICQRKPYNYKSDIWALGCVLFEMAALAHPFQACSFQHLLSLILTGERKELPRHCSTLVQDLVHLLLDENPETRPSTDEILGMPYLQPYLSEMWVAQSGRDLKPLSRMFSQKVDIRRHSVSSSLKIKKELTVRRASVSSVDSKTEKRRFLSVSKGRDLSKGSARSHSFKDQRNSIACSAIQMDNNYATYKVFHPTSLLKMARSSNISDLHYTEKKDAVTRCRELVRRIQNKDDSDYGSQCEEAYKPFTSKINSSKSTEVSFKKTSTKRNADLPDFHIEEYLEGDDVFVTNKINSEAQYYRNSSSQNHYCQHSQCQQCMIDMLWKNRIREQVRLPVFSETSEVSQKLQAVFGKDLFHTVYQALISQWEGNDSDCIPDSIKNIIDSLNFSQLQHLPLMMQLIQLDLITK